jgi:isopentenyl-diphosphate Delta-isomerase
VSQIHQRKIDHIQLCHQGDVSLPGDAGLWNEINLLHNAMPELSMSEIDLTTSFLGHSLQIPCMMTGMTGGPAQAREINRAMAQLSQKWGMVFGVGSQRVMTKDADSLSTFQVRDVAPDVVLMANIGVNQLRDLGMTVVRDLVDRIEANILAIHLNPAMELIQPNADADSDFSRGYESIARAVDTFDGQVIVKECGCGLSPYVVDRLCKVGVLAVDVSGVGGTSWVKLEAIRAQQRLQEIDGLNENSLSALEYQQQAQLGLLLQDWGIPTSAAVALSAQYPTQIVASGGIANPLIATKAMVLGADIVGFARPILQAYLNHGTEGADLFIQQFVHGLKILTALTGSRTVEQLKTAKHVIGPKLQAWIEQLHT